MTNLLFPTDFSTNNAAALEWVRLFAHKTGATITLLHVFQPMLPDTTLPTIGDDEYRLALRHEADAALRALPKSTAIQILTLCRILAFWRVGLMLPTQDVGAWAIKNLDPRFQTLIERATIERQSGNEPGAYNSYQLEQFAEYVRDMLLR